MASRTRASRMDGIIHPRACMGVTASCERMGVMAASRGGRHHVSLCVGMIASCARDPPYLGSAVVRPTLSPDLGSCAAHPIPSAATPKAPAAGHAAEKSASGPARSGPAGGGRGAGGGGKGGGSLGPGRMQTSPGRRPTLPNGRDAGPSLSHDSGSPAAMAMTRRVRDSGGPWAEISRRRDWGSQVMGRGLGIGRSTATMHLLAGRSSCWRVSNSPGWEEAMYLRMSTSTVSSCGVGSGCSWSPSGDSSCPWPKPAISSGIFTGTCSVIVSNTATYACE